MLKPVTADAMSQLQINYYHSVVAFTLLWYDYFLTVEEEAERYWKREKFTWGSFLFYLNRYGALFGHAPVAAEYFWVALNSEYKIAMCHKLQVYHQFYAATLQLFIAAILIMRMYALWERNRLVLGVLSVFVLGVMGFGCWAISSPDSGIPRNNPTIGCIQTILAPQGLKLALGWSCLLAFDVVVFILTVYKVHQFGQSGGLVRRIWRDGAIYVLFMCALNFYNILTFVYARPHVRGVATTLTNVVSTIMISRLMLNLRDPRLLHLSKRSQETTTSPSYPMISTVVDEAPLDTFWSQPDVGASQCEPSDFGLSPVDTRVSSNPGARACYTSQQSEPMSPLDHSDALSAIQLIPAHRRKP